MQTRESVPYVGRFAPSPTGPLHFGSLVAAAASYLQARRNNGRWLLRIEDIDPPRAQQGADKAIVTALHRYGFEWDGEVLRQSASHQQHNDALRSLIDRGHAYRCSCSRRDLADAPRSALGAIYPGTCRKGSEPFHRKGSDPFQKAAIRVRTGNDKIAFHDRLQGRIVQQLERESGDFVIRRRDGLIAYHLAVVVDDAIEGITEVVRGIDLIDSTPRQIWLQELLDYATPNYVHVPVITHSNGDKLSKLTGARDISLDAVEPTLVAALDALQQTPPPTLARSSIGDIWSWAEENWQVEKLRNCRAVVREAIGNSP